MSAWRPVLLSACVLALVLSGCIATDDPTDPVVDEPTATPVAEPVLPDPIEVSETVAGSADPLNMVFGTTCQTPTAKCYTYEFTSNASATIEAALTWMVPIHDFDLYLVQDDEQVEVAGDFPPETLEAIETGISPGTYQLVVVAWAVGADTFTLKATFS